MRSTDNYGLFAQAEFFGRTVRELLLGEPGPLTRMEWYLWQRWHQARARLQQQQKG